MTFTRLFNLQCTHLAIISMASLTLVGCGGGSDNQAASESPVSDGSGDNSGEDSGGDSGDNSGDTGSSGLTANVLCDYENSSYNESPSVMNTSNAKWTCDSNARLLDANGIPDHATGEFPNSGNPNYIYEYDVTASYSLDPVQTDNATTLGGPRGVLGYVLNGVKIDASTAGTCDDSGNNCSLIGNEGNWNIEALGQSNFNFGTDDNNAHVQPDGQYHYHGMPEGFIELQGGGEGRITLIAWAADGFPIYARYGYDQAENASSSIRPMLGSYQLVSSTSSNRPSVDIYPLGTFAQDWQYVAGSGDLDECNGRFGVTPEFPQGIYHYYATDTYPYFQRCIKGAI
ncbi:YHYH protein [Shewanella maritima]|nr:YHYH protein [Shewanella maritima]